jgi:Xaa-Pro aminopeptidase
MTGEPGGLPPLQVTGRLDRLRARLADQGDDGPPVTAVLITTPANIRWLSGFTGSSGLLLVTGDSALLTTDGRYRTQSGQQLEAAGVGDAIDIVVGGAQVQRQAVVDRSEGSGPLGLEADHVTWSGQRAWAGVFGPRELVPTQGMVEGLRVNKDPAEVARMERAAAIADEALADVLPLLAAVGGGEATGVLTESQFAAALDHGMRLRGAEDSAFETIVASGENSAKPHARPGGRPIGAGDPVVVDFGAVFDGYRSDMTRTFCVGGAPAGQMAAVFAAVADAQREGVAVVAPGVSAGSVDQACRQLLDARGWGDRFEHGTGHGVGLDIHERPSVGPGSTAILEVGTVVTVEPGVYLPGTGGVRIEDTLVVTEDGRRSLTRFPKEVVV